MNGWQEGDEPIIRWGIIGAGNVAEFKSGPALMQAPGSTVVAVMRRDAEEGARLRAAPRRSALVC